jgi:beta-glucosidase
MTSYNSYDGSPCSANDWLNNRLLKKELHFGGFVISDAGAVGGANVLHFTAADYAEAGKNAIESGLDVIFQTAFDHYTLFIPPFRDGRIDMAVIDSAVARVLRAKLDLGLFEHPYVNPAESAPLGNAEHRQLARRAAQESIVLLKNTGSTLPLSRTIKSIAVIGPDAAEPRLGGYSAPTSRKCSILDGIIEKLGETVDIRHTQGCQRLSPKFVGVPSECLSHLDQDSVRPGLLGEYFANVTLDSPAVFTRVDPSVEFQWTLFSPDPGRLPYDFYSVRWTGRLKAPSTGQYRIGIEGNDGYRLYIDDSLVIDNWIKASCRTVATAYSFEAEREYRLRVEYFEPTGNARIRLIWNVGGSSDEETKLQEAVALATACDAAIIAVGLEEGEFRDRASLALPGRQEELIKRVAALGKPTVVVLVGGSAVTMSSWLDDVPAVLNVWYPGEEGGRAVADVLFGDYNPAGRLPITFPVDEGQLPLVYNHKPTGRGDDYYDLTGQPLFPFGYGLSYTSFEYGDLRLDRPNIAASQATVARCTLKNTGSVEGDEVVQMYIRDELASVARPITELKGFQRVHLKPGEMRELSFAVTPVLLSMLDKNLQSVVEPGEFRVMIGASSKDIRLRSVLTVTD